jgi:hypothetical protein
MKINGPDFVGESLNAMGEALGFFLQMARDAKRPEEARMYYQDALNAGEKLAPYRYPRLASARVTVERDFMLPETATEREVRAEVIAELAKCTEVPRFIRDYIEAGLANRDEGMHMSYLRDGYKRVNGGEIALIGNAKKPS